MIVFETLNPKSSDAINTFEQVYNRILVPAFSNTRLRFDYNKLLDLFTNKALHNKSGLNCQLHVTLARNEDGAICGAAHWLSFDDLKCAFHLYTSVPEQFKGQGISTGLQHAMYKEINNYFDRKVPVFVEIRKEAIHDKPELLSSLGIHELRFNYRFKNDQDINTKWTLCMHGAKSIDTSRLKTIMQRQAEFYEGRNLSKEETAKHPSLQLFNQELDTWHDHVLIKPYSAELSYNFLSSAEVKGLSRAASEEEFERIKSGKTRTKPKILIHPTTGEMYRLVPKDPDAQGYAKGYYIKLETHPTIIDCYELTGDALKKYKEKILPPLPPDYEIHSFTLQEDEKRTLQKNEISARQLYELLTAVGVDSQWWPIEDPGYRAKEYFQKLSIHVLFHANRPVGVSMLDETGLENDKKVFGSFLGLLPEEKGRGLGGYLFDWGLKRIADKGAEKRLLVTSPQDVMSKQGEQDSAPPASTLYTKRGFTFLGREICTRDTSQAQRLLLPIGFPDHLSKQTAPEDFYLHPQTGEKLGRYTDTVMNKRIADAFTSKSKPTT